MVANSYMYQNRSHIRKLLLPVILRDSLFYFMNNTGYYLLRYQGLYMSALFNNQEFTPPVILYSDRNERYTSMILSLIVSLVLTNPLDVIATKIATQRDVWRPLMIIRSSITILYNVIGWFEHRNQLASCCLAASHLDLDFTSSRGLCFSVTWLQCRIWRDQRSNNDKFIMCVF